MQRCRFSARGLFVINSSKRSTHGNADFIGFGRTTRIAFFDTLIEGLSPAKTGAVLAHKLGHFTRHYTTKRLVVAFALSLAFLALLMVFFSMRLGFFSGPLLDLKPRKNEFEADAFTASQTQANALVNVLVRRQDNASALTLDLVYNAFYYSHRPASQHLNRLLGHA